MLDPNASALNEEEEEEEEDSGTTSRLLRCCILSIAGLETGDVE
jgi:hypothetical protein